MISDRLLEEARTYARDRGFSWADFGPAELLAYRDNPGRWQHLSVQQRDAASLACRIACARPDRADRECLRLLAEWNRGAVPTEPRAQAQIIHDVARGKIRGRALMDLVARGKVLLGRRPTGGMEEKAS